jgi:hypothetical protein
VREAAPNASKNGRGKVGPPATSAEQQPEPKEKTQPEKKKGLFDKIFGIFGGQKQPDTSKPH